MGAQCQGIRFPSVFWFANIMGRPCKDFLVLPWKVLVVVLDSFRWIEISSVIPNKVAIFFPGRENLVVPMLNFPEGAALGISKCVHVQISCLLYRTRQKEISWLLFKGILVYHLPELHRNSYRESFILTMGVLALFVGCPAKKSTHGRPKMAGGETKRFPTPLLALVASVTQRLRHTYAHRLLSESSLWTIVLHLYFLGLVCLYSQFPREYRAVPSWSTIKCYSKRNKSLFSMGMLALWDTLAEVRGVNQQKFVVWVYGTQTSGELS